MTDLEIHDIRATRSQSISPIGWVALVALCGIGLHEAIKGPPISTTLESVAPGQLVIVRMPQGTFDFPILGARVTLPDGWAYLSTTNPSLATNPTFVNKATQSIVTLRSAYDILHDPNRPETDRSEFDGGFIDWFKAPGANHSISTTAFGINLPPSWLNSGVHRVGLMASKDATVVLSDFSPGTSPRPGDRTEESVLEFCRSIEPIPTD